MRRTLVRVGVALVVFNLALAGIGLVVRLLMPSRGDDDSDELALAAVMNGIDLHSRAVAFRGGSSRAIMGGVRLDLRGATLDPAGGRLDLLAVMGGIQVIVPGEWRAHVRASRSVLGGTDIARLSGGDGGDGPALEISALAVMGGIEVMVRSRAGVPGRPAMED